MPLSKLSYVSPTGAIGLMCVALWTTGCRAPDEGVTKAPEQFGVVSDADQLRLKVAALVREGREARRRGDLKEAQRKLSEALKLDMASGPACHALGLVFWDQRDLYQAALHLERASRILRNQVEPCYNLGVVLERGGQYENAMNAYQRALRRQDTHLPSMENLARVRIKLGLRDAETLRLISATREREVRPDWIEWLSREESLLQTRLHPIVEAEVAGLQNPSLRRLTSAPAEQ